MAKRILIIDDQEIERTALKTILSAQPDWQLSEAHDGQHALDVLLTSSRPHLCLVDLRMPNVDGVEFLRRVRRDPHLRDLKVVVSSASRDRATIIELAKLGIDGYLLKPFVAEKTLAVVKPIMDAFADTPADKVRDLLTKTALVCDDDPVVRTALEAQIKTETHWAVAEAASGKDALEKLRGGLRPNLCFIDLQMPEMDGVQLLTTIRQDPALEKLRVAITSGERDVEKIRSLASLGIEGYLLKPVDPVKLRAVLRAIP